MVRLQFGDSVGTQCLLSLLYAQNHPLAPHCPSSVPTDCTDDGAEVTEIALRQLNAMGELNQGAVLLDPDGGPSDTQLPKKNLGSRRARS